MLGEQDPIVGISGYVVRPPQAHREKPRISAFTSANVDKILALKPDLVLTFSDLQANVAADLIRRGLNLHAFNRPSVYRPWRCVVRELLDGIGGPAPGRRAVVIAVGRQFVGPRGAFLERFVAIALEHELRGSPNVDLGYHSAKAARPASIKV